MAEQKILLNGHYVSHSPEANEGIHYLMHKLNSEERKVFFDQAYRHGHAIFEDHLGHGYELTYHNGAYALTKAKV